MAAKLDGKGYKNRHEFRDDFKLMIANAKLYNQAGSYVHNEAIALEVFFEKRKPCLSSVDPPNLTVMQNGRLSTRPSR